MVYMEILTQRYLRARSLHQRAHRLGSCPSNSDTANSDRTTALVILSFDVLLFGTERVMNAATPLDGLKTEKSLHQCYHQQTDNRICTDLQTSW